MLIRNGNTVIYLPVRLTGNTPERRTEAMIAAQTKASQITSSDGKLSMAIENADVVNASMPITFDISDGKQDMGNEQGEGIHTQTLSGHLDGGRADIGSTITHDSTHPLGVRDQYVYQRDDNGNVVHAPNGDPVVVADPTNTNIMGPNLGNTLEQSQINDTPSLRNGNVATCSATNNSGAGCE